LGAIIIVAAVAHDRTSGAIAAIFGIILGLSGIPGIGTWPAPGAIALLLFALLAWRATNWRRELKWLLRGRLDVVVVGLVGACVAIAGVALLVWYTTLHPDVSDIREAMFPPFPAWALILGGIGFSAVNAAVEEGLFRGLLLDMLDRSLGNNMAALFLQAAAFGLLHIHGFPRGVVGVVLATIYGLMMGVLRRRSGGMLAPWLGHVATDVVIVCILVFVE
jgi:membrane protease YdiL (CAAX protease family)